MNELPAILQPPGLAAPLPVAAAGASARADRAGGGPGRLTEKTAKDFEALLLHKVMQEMAKTIPDSGLIEGGMTRQMMDFFWFNLSGEMARAGGLGLWKEITRQWNRPAGGAGGSSPTDTVAAPPRGGPDTTPAPPKPPPARGTP